MAVNPATQAFPPSHLGNSNEFDCARFGVGWPLATYPLRKRLLWEDKPSVVATDAFIPRRRPPNLRGQSPSGRKPTAKSQQLKNSHRLHGIRRNLIREISEIRGQLTTATLYNNDDDNENMKEWHDRD